MEVVLGRYLRPGEVVDHIDNHPRHNWPDNLRLFDSNAEHLRQTLRAEWYDNSPRRLIAYAHPCSQGTDRLIGKDEMLVRFPERMRESYEYHVRIHLANSSHSHLAKKEFLREGPSSDPFQL
ncbi:MAG: HNH endonuclease [Gammaproteobacteria bacterium]|nr:HNH endonuclease [Gammaproteobacteria bacterium]